MPEKLLVYQAYLLRLWRDQAGAPWRATLIDAARPAEQRHFASMEALLAFLLARTGPEPPGQQQASQAAQSGRDAWTPDGAH